MNKNHLFTMGSSLLLLGGILGIGLFQLNPRDFQVYHELDESSHPQRKNALLSFSQQHRKGVTKEAWLHEAPHLHVKISSEESDLFFFQGSHRQVELVEEMKGVKGLMQEELFVCLPDGTEALVKEEGKYLLRGKDPNSPEAWLPPEKIREASPYQLVRYFEADVATYQYSSQCLNAEDVKLWKYKLPGHSLPSEGISGPSLMAGVAERVEFLLKNESMNFTAYQWRMSFDPQLGGI